MASQPCAGQATITSAPSNNYLLRVTQDWGRNSALGDLVAASFGRDDLELRFWSGYGGGTNGLILRRISSQWSVWRAAVVPCLLNIPMAVGDTLSPAAMENYRHLALANCTSRPEAARTIPNDRG